MTIPSSDSQKLFEFNNSYLLLPSVFFSKQNPTIVCSPKVVMLNHDLARSINFPISHMSDDDAAAFFRQCCPQRDNAFFSAYAGHQFGHFTMLGDGRAHILGEHQLPDGRHVDIQLKGQGARRILAEGMATLHGPNATGSIFHIRFSSAYTKLAVVQQVALFKKRTWGPY